MSIFTNISLLANINYNIPCPFYIYVYIEQSNAGRGLSGIDSSGNSV